jgi:hypothetical protein
VSIITWVGGDVSTLSSNPLSWNDPKNWTGGTGTVPAVPVDDDAVVIAATVPNNDPIIDGQTNGAVLQTLTVHAGATLTVGSFTFIATAVTNDGTIAGTSPFGNATGVEIFNGAGTLTNSGTITGDVNGDGVVLRAGGTITNSQPGIITGGTDGVDTGTLLSATITNEGQITGTGGDGVLIGTGGAITNSATGVILGATAGVQSSGAATTVTNSGKISGTGSKSVGVLFSDSPGKIFDNTLINNGTIIGNGAAAVQFGAGNDVLVLWAGASFTGLVDGGAGTNTLELAAGAAGRLAGLGSSFTHFGPLLIDAGAKWTLVDTAHNAFGGNSITGLTSLDTIDLAGFAFTSVSGTFANNALVVSNATTKETLHIQGNFSSAMQFSSDGSGGTDIVLTPLVPPAATPAPAPVVPPASTPDLSDKSISELDTTTDKSIGAITQAYTGPVAGLQHQYIDTSPDNLNITATTPNWFLHTGAGEDAITVNSGTNVLDGGTGSNFLTGGSGVDTFFADDRLAAADIWSTIVGFHAGDEVTIWGVTPHDFTFDFEDNQGAAGFTGLTFHATAAGHPIASVTLAGFSTLDLADGRITETAGLDGTSGSTFTNFHANS